MNGVWRDIQEYEGYYQVSNRGNVRSVERTILKSNGVCQSRRGKILVPKINDNGYMIVRLSKNGSRKQFGVHTLVAREFVSRYFDGAEINHMDFDRSNNRHTNLEWVSHIENIHYSMVAHRHVTQTHDFAGAKNPNYGNHKLRERYASNPNEAQEKQSRPGKLNGRAIPIIMIDTHGNKRVFDYMGQCGEYLIKSGISRAKKAEGLVSHISEAAMSGKTYLGCLFHFRNR